MNITQKTQLEEKLAVLYWSERKGLEIKDKVKRIHEERFLQPELFKELDIQALPSDTQRPIEGLKRQDLSREDQNMILIKSGGTGKTLVSVSRGVTACEKGYRVCFRTAAQLVDELKESESQKHMLSIHK